MDELTEGRPDLLAVDKSDLWAMLEWQQSQIHHYQSMSRGILGLLAAVLTVIFAALTTPLLNPPKSLPTDYSPVKQVVTEMPIGHIAGRIVIAVSILYLLVLILWAILSGIIAGIRFTSVLFDFRIDTGIEPGETRLLIPRLEIKNLDSEDSFISLSRSVNRNQIILNQITDSFRSALVRLLLALSLTVSVVLLHSWIVNFDVWMLIYINIFPLVPVQISVGIPARLAGLIPGDEDRQADSDEQVGSKLEPYFEAYDETVGESIVSGLMTVFNLIVAITVLLSLIYNFLI